MISSYELKYKQTIQHDLKIRLGSEILFKRGKYVKNHLRSHITHSLHVIKLVISSCSTLLLGKEKFCGYKDNPKNRYNGTSPQETGLSIVKMDYYIC